MNRNLLLFVIWNSLVLSYFENKSDLPAVIVIPTIVLTLAKFYKGSQPALTWIGMFLISITIAHLRLSRMVLGYLGLL